MQDLQLNNYQASAAEAWQGRVDGLEQADLRWHQVFKALDLMAPLPAISGAIVLLGFSCDEGVRRNLGRVGASEAPAHIRRILCNLPVHHAAEKVLWDAGNIICADQDLDLAQQQLAIAVQKILAHGAFPIVLGGGHEVTFGHYQGLDLMYPQTRIGVLNFDAHFDLRESHAGQASSGTGFYQIIEKLKPQGRSLSYMALGIQQISNTQSLFNYADAHGVDYIFAHELKTAALDQLKQRVRNFIKELDHLYLTIDLDVFNATIAPGVSATAFQGIDYDEVFKALFQEILISGKLRSYDIAELNPNFDIDFRTAKLAAQLIFDSLKELPKA